VAQVAGRSETAGLTDPQVLHKVLSEPSNRYLVRELCWVLAIEGQDTYILVPRDDRDWDLLAATIRPAPRRRMDLDVVIGTRGRIAPADMCNGLTVPIVTFDQLYSFDRDHLIKSIPRPADIPAKQFEPAAEEVLNLIMQMANNLGVEDRHRAVNYLAVRYPAIYATVAEAFHRSASLTAVEVRPSRLSSTQNISDVVFSLTDRKTGVIDKFFTSVNVSGKYPHIVTPMSRYYDR
jgi:hypothetical protein